MVSAQNHQVRLYRFSFDPQAGPPPVPSYLSAKDGPALRPGYRLLHFLVPMNADIKRKVEDAGLTLLSYVPDNTYVVKLTAGIDLSSLPFVVDAGPFQPAYRMHPALDLWLTPDRSADPSQGLVSLTLHKGAAWAPVLSALAGVGGEVVASVDAYGLRRATVRITMAGALPTLAQVEELAWIAPVPRRATRNGRAQWLVQSYQSGQMPPTMATPVYDAGLHGENEIVGVIDEAILTSSCFFFDTSEPDAGPAHRKLVYLNQGNIARAHGTHVAGTVAGIPENGDTSEAGIAHGARLAFTDFAFVGNQSEELLNFFLTHAAQGASIHTNSWGATNGTPFNTDYNIDCVDIDTLMYEDETQLVIFACMNDTTFPLAGLLSPENALNVLAVGATETGVVDPEVLAERHGSSRMGPTVLDGRRKPEIFAPGCGLTSASLAACGTQTMCGTSMAAPVVAGGATLVRQYFREGFYPSGAADGADSFTPSGALIKAVLLNGTENMLEESEDSPGVYSDLPIPNDVEGWGRMHLDNSLYFSGDDLGLLVWDQPNGQGLSTGASRFTRIEVTDTSQPLRLTMAFTAPPAALFAATPVANDLDLLLHAPDGSVYAGNDWQAGVSVPGALTRDPLNNVEQILLPVPQTGTYLVEIMGAAVNVDTQGFALAMTGALSWACADGSFLPSVSIGCNGEPAAYGFVPACGQGITNVSWTPQHGVSDPGSPFALLSGDQPTTFTFQFQDADSQQVVTQEVYFFPLDADVNGDQVPDANDFLAFLGLDFWATSSSSPDNAWAAAQPWDMDNNEKIDIRELLYLMECLAFP